MDKIEKRSNFSKNLIKFRKERKLTQDELAKLSGLTRRMIGYYEKEASKPPIDNIEAIAKALNITINDLLEKKDSTEIQNEFTDIDTRTLKKLKQILSLPKHERHIIYSMADSFLEKKKKLNKKQLQESKK
jgi:transcriptional regulator with XRE-family HTH domain